MAKGDDILERLLDLATLAADLPAGLGKNPAATHVANQLIRCGTSPFSTRRLVTELLRKFGTHLNKSILFVSTKLPAIIL